MKHVDALSRYLTMTIVDQSISMGKQKAQEQDDQDDGKDSYNDYFFRGGVVHKLVNDTELVVVHICKGKSSRKIHASKKFRYLISIRIAEVAPFGKKCATSAALLGVTSATLPEVTSMTRPDGIHFRDSNAISRTIGFIL